MNSYNILKWNGQEPEGLISPTRASSLEKNYKNNQYQIINKAVNLNKEIIASKIVSGANIQENETLVAPSIYKDTREVWFSMNDIVGYLTMVQNHAVKNGYQNLGIRIYNGSYIKDGEPKTTVFLVPTYDNNADDVGDSSSFDNLIKENTNVLGFDDPTQQQNMYDMKCLNYGNSGKPPIEYDPSNGEN
ncbi:hypothetical protein [Kordia antarctica]|nr:hypothetical protein [Kordia antarctica]